MLVEFHQYPSNDSVQKKTEFTVKKKQNVSENLLCTYRKKKGVKLYQIHRETHEVKEIECNERAVFSLLENETVSNGKFYSNHKLYSYVEAINEKNALRKYLKYGKE